MLVAFLLVPQEYSRPVRARSKQDCRKRHLQIDTHSFIGGNSRLEYALSFFQQTLDVLVSAGVMPDEEAFCSCLSCYFGRFFGRTVESFFGSCPILLHKSGFMVEQIHTLNNRDDGGIKLRIRAVSISSGRCARGREVSVGDDPPIRCRVVGSFYDEGIFGKRNIVELGSRFVQMPCTAFFFEEVARRRDAVAERYAIDFDGFVLMHKCMSGGIDRMYLHLIGHSVTELLQYGAEETLYSLRPMYMQGAGTSQQTKCGDKSGQAETVIAMQMADENMDETPEMELFESELSLDTFSAIDHVKFVA